MSDNDDDDKNKKPELKLLSFADAKEKKDSEEDHEIVEIDLVSIEAADLDSYLRQCYIHSRVFFEQALPNRERHLEAVALLREAFTIAMSPLNEIDTIFGDDEEEEYEEDED